MPVVIAAAAFCMTLLGGWVAMRITDRKHLVLGLAAGLMLGVVAFDLIPEALAEQKGTVFGVPSALLMLVAGFLSLHLIERSVAIHRAHEGEYEVHVHAHGHAHGRNQQVGMLAGSALIGHSVLDGFAIGAAFQASSAIGGVVAIAVIAHDFADGFNTFTVASMYGHARRRAIMLLLCDAVAPIAGAALTLTMTIPSGMLGLYLGFFAGFLLYLATSDILPEAHSHHSTRATLAFTVAGAGFMWLVIGALS